MSKRIFSREELFFSFVMNVSTKRDFEYFVSLHESKKSLFISNNYANLNSFFSKHYFSLRERATLLGLPEERCKILDKKFFRDITPKELLQKLNEYLNNNENKIKENELKIRLNLYSKKEANKKIIELDYYLLLFFKIQDYKKQLEPLLDNAQLIQFADYYKGKNVDCSTISEKMNQLNEKEQFIYIILLFSEDKDNCSLMKLQPYLNGKIAIQENVIVKGLDFVFYIINSSDIQISKSYIEKFNILFLNKENQVTKKIVCWLFEIIKQKKLDIWECYSQLQKHFKYMINILLHFEELSLLSSFLISLLDKIKYKEDIIPLYKNIMSKEAIEAKVKNVYFEYVIFYLFFLYEKFLFENSIINLQKIRVNQPYQNSKINFEIHLIFVYIWGRHCREKQDSLTQYIDNLQKNNENTMPDIEKYYPNKQPSPNISNYFWKDKFQFNITISELQPKREFTNKIYYDMNKLIKLFSNIKTLPMIAFVKFNNWINKDIANQIQIIKEAEYNFILNGIVIFDKQYQLYIFLWNEITNQWKCLYNYKNVKDIEIESLYLVYFGKTKNENEMTFDNQINSYQESSQPIINISNKNEEDELYYNSVKIIMNESPYLFNLKQKYFCTAFGLNEEHKIEIVNEVNIKDMDIDISTFDCKEDDPIKYDEILFKQFDELINDKTALFFEDNEEIFFWLSNKIENNDKIDIKLGFYIGLMNYSKLYKQQDNILGTLFQFKDGILTNEQINNIIKIKKPVLKEISFRQLFEKLQMEDDIFYIILFKSLYFMDWIMQNQMNLTTEGIKLNIEWLFENKSCFLDQKLICFFPRFCEYFLNVQLKNNIEMYYVCLELFIEISPLSVIYLKEIKIEEFINKLEKEYLFINNARKNFCQINEVKLYFKLIERKLKEKQIKIDNNYVILYFYVYLIHKIQNNKNENQIILLNSILDLLNKDLNSNLYELAEYFVQKEINLLPFLQFDFDFTKLNKEYQFVIFILFFLEKNENNILKKIQPFLNGTLIISENLIIKGLDLVFNIIDLHVQKIYKSYIEKFNILFIDKIQNNIQIKIVSWFFEKIKLIDAKCNLIELENELKDNISNVVKTILKLENQKDLFEWIFTTFDKINCKLGFYIGLVFFYKINGKIDYMDKIFSIEKRIDKTKLDIAFNVSNQLNQQYDINSLIPKIVIHSNDDILYFTLLKFLIFMNWVNQNKLKITPEKIQKEVENLLQDKQCFSFKELDHFFPSLFTYFFKPQLHETHSEIYFTCLESFIDQSPLSIEYLIQLKMEDFIKNLEKNYMSNNHSFTSNEVISSRLYIKRLYRKLKEDNDCQNLINKERSFTKLYFYLYFILIIQSNENEHRIKQIEIMFNNIKYNLKDLALYFTNNKIDFSFMMKLKYDLSYLKEEEQFLMHVFYYLDNNEEKELQKISSFLNSIKFSKIEKGLNIIFENIESSTTQKTIEYYAKYFNILLPKNENNKPSKFEEKLVSWLFKNLLKINSHLNMLHLYDILKSKLLYISNVLLGLKEYDLLSKILIIQTDQIVDSSKLINIYEGVVVFIQQEEARKQSSKLEYSLFYFWILYEYYNSEYTITKLKKVQIHPNNPQITFDVKFLFAYLHHEIKKMCIRQNNEMSKLMLLVDDTTIQKPINPLILSNTFTKEELFITCSPKRKYTNNSKYNSQKVKTIISKLNDKPLIIFIVFTTWINKYIINKIKIIEKEKYFFNLKGIVLTYENNQKQILIGYNVTDKWNCLNKEIKNNLSKIISLHLVYFRCNKVSSELNLDNQLNHYESLEPIVKVNSNEESNLYWDSLFKIAEINSKIIELKKPYIELAFKLNNESNKENKSKLYNLMTNEKDEGFNIDILNQNEFDPNNDEQILFEQFQEVINSKGTIDYDDIEEIYEWLENKINKEEKMNNLIGFYCCILILFKKCDLINDFDKIYEFDKLILLDNQIKNLSILSKKIKITNDLHNLIKKIEINEDKFYPVLFKSFIFIYAIKQKILFLDSNFIQNEIVKFTENKEVCFSTQNFQHFIPNICEHYLKKEIKNLDKYYTCLYMFMKESLQLQTLNNRTNNMVFKYVEFLIEHPNYINNFLDSNVQNFKTIINILFTKKKEIILADLLMLCIELCIDNEYTENLRTFYKTIKDILKQIYFQKKTLEPLLKIAIIIFFMFNKIFYKKKLLNQTKVIPFVNNDISSFIDLQLKFIFIKSQILEHLKNNSKSIDSNVIEIYNAFINYNQNNEKSNSCKECYNKIKQNDINSLFKLNSQLLDIIDFDEEKNIYKRSNEKLPYLFFIQHPLKKIKSDFLSKIDLPISDKVNYEIIGLYMIISNKKKNDFSKCGLVYNKYSNKWYSINDVKWINEPESSVIKNASFLFIIYTKKKNKIKEPKIDFDGLNSIKFDKDAIIFFENKFEYSKVKEWLKKELNKKTFSQYEQFLKKLLKTPSVSEKQNKFKIFK